MNSIAEIKSRANGNWKCILSALGVAPKYLTGKHSPCPACGGKDRFRYTDYHGNGEYICNQCGNGDGFNLLMAAFGYSFPECRDAVAKQLGYDVNVPNKPPEKRFKPLHRETQAKTVIDNLKRIQGYLTDAKPITKDSPAGKYLANRGLDWLQINQGIRNIFYRHELDYWTPDAYGRPFKVGSFPAMVSKIIKDGELMGVHLTYLHNIKGVWRKADISNPTTGEKLPNKKMQTRYTGALSGASIQLYQPYDGMLAVCEGIETALAVRQLFGLPVWACGSAGMLRQVKLPPDVRTLYIVADNDDNNAGRDACRDLSNRAITEGLAVKHWRPPTIGHDALDELNRQQQEKTQ